jgi:hypothetical protein
LEKSKNETSRDQDMPHPDPLMSDSVPIVAFDSAFNFLLKMASKSMRDSEQELRALDDLLTGPNLERLPPSKSDLASLAKEQNDQFWNEWQELRRKQKNLELLQSGSASVGESLPFAKDLSKEAVKATPQDHPLASPIDNTHTSKTGPSTVISRLSSSKGPIAAVRRSSVSRPALENPFQDVQTFPTLQPKKSFLGLSDLKQWVGAALEITSSSAKKPLSENQLGKPLAAIPELNDDDNWTGGHGGDSSQASSLNGGSLPPSSLGTPKLSSSRSSLDLGMDKEMTVLLNGIPGDPARLLPHLQSEDSPVLGEREDFSRDMMDESEISEIKESFHLSPSITEPLVEGTRMFKSWFGLDAKSTTSLFGEAKELQDVFPSAASSPPQ